MVYVTCDVCGNPCGGQEDLCDNAGMARSYARLRGWARRPPRDTDQFYRERNGAKLADVCPDCQN
jgi:hypothetical protein